jgi:uracil-DNA glycosylase family 4
MHGTDFSEIEGTGSIGVMVVGEASGEHEARDQLPFRPFAPAGGVLERVIRRMALDRQQFAVTNVLRCRPKNNWLDKAPWEFSALASCRPNLVAAIGTRQPRAIAALGGIATRELTGLAGEKLGVSYLAGYVVPVGASLAGLAIPVVPNYHPAFLRRGKASYQGLFARNLQRAINVANGKDLNFTWSVNPDDESTWGGKKYNLHPSQMIAEQFAAFVEQNPNLPVAEDIETAESASMDEDAREGFVDTDIRQIQFYVEPCGAIAMPWKIEYLPAIISILHSRNVKYGHNWDNYDHKVIRAASRREGWEYNPRTRVFDTLDMFHHWQPDLPAHLQAAASFVNFPFPWKHMHTIEHEPFYGCVDADATWQLGEMCVRNLKREGLWDDSAAA